MTDDLPLTVVHNDDESFTIEWDDKHPVCKQLNDWSENDFLNCLREQLELPQEFSVNEFQDRFDELFARVENGETFIIRHPDGQKVYITPLNND